jgi:hypothetical protein
MNGLGSAPRRVGAVGAATAVLWVLGVGAVGSTLAQGSPLRAERVAQSAGGRLAERGMLAGGECLPASAGPLFSS